MPEEHEIEDRYLTDPPCLCVVEFHISSCSPPGGGVKDAMFFGNPAPLWGRSLIGKAPALHAGE